MHTENQMLNKYQNKNHLTHTLKKKKDGKLKKIKKNSPSLFLLSYLSHRVSLEKAFFGNQIWEKYKIVTMK